MVTVLESLLAIPALKSGPDTALEAQMPHQVALVRVSAAAFRATKRRPVLHVLQSLPNCNIRRKGYNKTYTQSLPLSFSLSLSLSLVFAGERMQTREALRRLNDANENTEHTYSESCRRSSYRFLFLTNRPRSRVVLAYARLVLRLVAFSL